MWLGVPQPCPGRVGQELAGRKAPSRVEEGAFLCLSESNTGLELDFY